MILGITVQDCVNQENNMMKVDNVWFATPVFAHRCWGGFSIGPQANYVCVTCSTSELRTPASYGHNCAY